MSTLWDAVWKRALYPPRVYWCNEEFLHYLVNWSRLVTREALFLELGAGSGRFSYHLSKRGNKVVALDFSRASIDLLKRMRKRGKVGFHVVQADVLSMPFKEGAFNVIYSEGLLEHFRNFNRFFEEATRVMQKSGILILSVPNKFSFHTFGRFLVSKLMRSWWLYGYERSFSKKELRHLLQSSGLRNIEIHGIGLLHGVGIYMSSDIRALLYLVYVRIRGKKLGVFLTEQFGFQIIGKAEK